MSRLPQHPQVMLRLLQLLIPHSTVSAANTFTQLNEFTLIHFICIAYFSNTVKSQGALHME